MGDRVRRGDVLFTMYGESKDRLQLAEKALEKNEVLKIK
jgi:thymidine phosphorylase